MKINFNQLVNQILEDCAAGGSASVFTTGPVTAGQYGNQFPSQNDRAYAPGDARLPYAIGAKSKKKKKKILIQRRSRS